MSSVLGWAELGGVELHGCSHGVLLPRILGSVGVLIWAAPSGQAVLVSDSRCTRRPASYRPAPLT